MFLSYGRDIDIEIHRDDMEIFRFKLCGTRRITCPITVFEMCILYLDTFHKQFGNYFYRSDIIDCENNLENMILLIFLLVIIK